MSLRRKIIVIDSCLECRYMHNYHADSVTHLRGFFCMKLRKKLEYPGGNIPEWCPLDDAGEDGSMRS